MKKKLFMFLLLFTFSFAFVSCSADDDSSSKRQEEEDDDDEDDKDKDDKDDKDNDDDKKDKDDDDTKEPESTPEPEATPEPTPKPEINKVSIEMPSELSDNLYDYQFSIDGQVYDLPMWFSNMEALGWEYLGNKDEKLKGNYSTSEQWTKDEMQIWSNITNYSINAAKLSDCQITGIEIDVDDFDESVTILLPEGIQLGLATHDDIVAAYGEPTDIYEGSYSTTLYYDESYEKGVELKVDNETGVLTGVELQYEVALEGVDNSVNPNAPDSFAEYVSPTKLSDDIFDVAFELEGVKYQFPVPVPELLKNGFAYVYEDTKDEVVAAGNDSVIYLMYGNIEMYANIINFEDTATYTKNCYVTSVGTESSSSDGSKLRLTISGNIESNVSTEEELIDALGEYNYSVNEYDSYTSYFIYDPKGYAYSEYGDYTNACDFDVEEGIVTSIRRGCTKPLKPIR